MLLRPAARTEAFSRVTEKMACWKRGVELASERSSGNAPSSAYVTMGSLGEAEAAVRRFHGRLFLDRSVMVGHAPAGETRPDEPRKAKPAAAGVSISQQYRERQGMVYELDCAGLRLTLRFFFRENDRSPRRVEATANQGQDFVAEATGATRESALVAVADTWRHLAVEPPAPELDWSGVTAALRLVRAV